jgi:hypothetical protein
MAIKGHAPKAFGLRRPFAEDSQEMLMGFAEKEITSGNSPLVLLEEITGQEIIQRGRYTVNLLHRRKLDRQLKQGIVLGYEYGKKVAAAQHEIGQNTSSNIDAKLGEIVIIKSRMIAMRVESQRLEHDLSLTEQMLGRFGMHGLMKGNKPPLHVTVWETLDFIAQRKQKDIIQELNEVMPVGETVWLEDIEIYPNDADIRGDNLF